MKTVISLIKVWPLVDLDKISTYQTFSRTYVKVEQT